MRRLKIAVLRGGPSVESKLSVSSGKNIIDILDLEHDVTDIVVDKELNWYSKGLQFNPKDLASKFDLVVNTIKGAYGEDGRLSSILNQHGVKYTGPKVFSAMFSYDKAKTKSVLNNHKIKTPLHKVIYGKENLDSSSREIFESMLFPLVVKPLKGGSSMGVFVVKDYNELKNAMYSILAIDDAVIVEEYIKGKDASVFVTENFRNQKRYSFLPVTYDNEDDDLVDFDKKINQQYSFNDKLLSPYEKDLLSNYAKQTFDALNLRHHAIVDFRVHPKRGVYVLEANSVPIFGENTIVNESLKSVGATEKELLEHLIELVLNER
jgi:D-alanine-D-alanine ligase